MSKKMVGLVTCLMSLASFATVNNCFAKLAVGDVVFVRLTGEAAKVYAAQSGMQLPPAKDLGLAIEVTATVEQLRPDGKIRIECSQTNKGGKNKPQMITLTVLVDPAKLTSDTTPAGTAVYASPADYENGVKPTKTSGSQRNVRLSLSDLHGVKIRSWSLLNEVGE
jgi:hypothetical protein